MKIPPSKAELAEAWILGTYGAITGVYKEYIAPELKDRPIPLYALCGVLGGIAVAKWLGE